MGIIRVSPGSSDFVIKSGNRGDFISKLLVVPKGGGVGTGSFVLKDGDEEYVFQYSLAESRAYTLDLEVESGNGGWSVTTDGNVEILVIV